MLATGFSAGNIEDEEIAFWCEGYVAFELAYRQLPSQILSYSKALKKCASDAKIYSTCRVIGSNELGRALLICDITLDACRIAYNYGIRWN